MYIYVHRQKNKLKRMHSQKTATVLHACIDAYYVPHMHIHMNTVAHGHMCCANIFI